MGQGQGQMRNVQTATAATGVFGMVGNKGACSVRFEVFDTSVCVVCAHLAAHQDAVDTRNQNVRDIYLKTSFPLDSPPRSTVPERHHPRVAATSLNALQAGSLTISEHDYEFWIGDFNYRLDGSLSPSQAIAEVQQQNLMSLREKDQLEREMKAGRVFRGLSEIAPLTFFPTYKFEPGTDLYDQRPEKKLRAPAWTDRILGPGGMAPPALECLGYGRVDEVRVSDHKPVCALVKFQVTKVIDAKREVEYKDLLKRLGEKQETAAAAVVVAPVNSPTAAAGTASPGSIKPRRVSVTPSSLTFADVGYRESADQVFTIKNVSSGVVVWRFASRPGDDVGQFSSQSVRVNVPFGLLMPGESCPVCVTFRPLSCSQRVISDVLDLHVLPLTNQRDAMGRAGTLMDPSKATTDTDLDVEQTVIALHCTTRPSCFGASLHSLVATQQPPARLPPHLVRIVSKLVQDGSLESAYRLFLTPVDPVELGRVRHALDRNEPFHEGVSPHVLAMAALEFLDKLESPVVPPDVVSTEDFSPDTFDSTAFYNLLNPLHGNTLALVVAMVRKILFHADTNRASLTLLAPIFAFVLFRPSDMADFSKEQSAVKASGFGEFTSWLASSTAQAVMGSSGASSDKAKDRAAWDKAVAVFQALVGG